MTLKEFILGVNQNAYNPQNLPEALIESGIDYVSYFFPVERNFTSNSSDLIIQFVEEYKSGFNLISHISFNDEIVEDESYIHFGWSKEDLLVIDKVSGEIFTMDYAVYGRKTFVCAASSELFMKAFLIGGFHDIDKKFNHKNEEKEYLISKAKDAAITAGGIQYLRYWNSLNNTDIIFDESGQAVNNSSFNSGSLLN